MLGGLGNMFYICSMYLWQYLVTQSQELFQHHWSLLSHTHIHSLPAARNRGTLLQRRGYHMFEDGSAGPSCSNRFGPIIGSASVQYFSFCMRRQRLWGEDVVTRAAAKRKAAERMTQFQIQQMYKWCRLCPWCWNEAFILLTTGPGIFHKGIMYIISYVYHASQSMKHFSVCRFSRFFIQLRICFCTSLCCWGTLKAYSRDLALHCHKVWGHKRQTSKKIKYVS